MNDVFTLCYMLSCCVPLYLMKVICMDSLYKNTINTSTESIFCNLFSNLPFLQERNKLLLWNEVMFFN